MTPRARTVTFIGSALDDLRAFPSTVRRDAGYQLDRVQQGLDPIDWKLMTTIGRGVGEIRLRDEAGAFRIVYVAKLQGSVFVLHCFQKKSQATDKPDIDLATKRYRDLLKEIER
ncbi:MAG: type II toxin-antitoxin system RelE/ParE family toxin [Aliihoeflea sp.]|uniref:type II toxin-antitoxin system RelE/ParE family toxin n=1 Tax=Aliihoeflea sp. TaxID=2608088 RepID=UPI004033528F